MRENPYASPQSSVDAIFQATNRGELQVDGLDLLVRSGGKLPSYCIKTNVPITENDFRKKTFTWCPQWVLFLVFLSPLILLIVYFITCKKCMLTFGLSPEIRRKYRNRIAAKCCIVLALLGLTIGSGMLGYAEVAVCAGGLCIIGFLVSLFGNSPLRVVKHNDRTFWIRGCSDEFLSNFAAGGPTGLQRFTS